jgi:hypothetical protein
MIGRVIKLVVISRTGERSQVLHNLKNNTVLPHAVKSEAIVLKHEDVLLTLQKSGKLTVWPHMLHSSKSCL